MKRLVDVAQQARFQAMLPAAIAARQSQPAPAPGNQAPALSPALQDADRAFIGIMLGVAAC